MTLSICYFFSQIDVTVFSKPILNFYIISHIILEWYQELSVNAIQMAFRGPFA